MKVRVINKMTKREIPNFMLHLYITYDEKGNMKCIDDEYDIQFEDEDLRIYNETLEDKLEMWED